MCRTSRTISSSRRALRTSWPASFSLQHAAETAPRGALGVRLAHARAHVLARHRLDVKRHLPIHLAVAGAPREERDQPADETRRANGMSGSLFDRAQHPA